MSEFVCPGCGRGDQLYRTAEVVVQDMEVGVRVRNENGKPVFRDDPDPDVFLSDYDVSKSRTVYCDCGARFKDEGELRCIFEDWQPGDVAVLPDGLKGVLASVEDDRCTVVGWHEVFTFRDLSPVSTATRVAVL